MARVPVGCALEQGTPQRAVAPGLTEAAANALYHTRRDAHTVALAEVAEGCVHPQAVHKVPGGAAGLTGRVPKLLGLVYLLALLVEVDAQVAQRRGRCALAVVPG